MEKNELATTEKAELAPGSPDLTQAFIEAAKMGPEGAETIAKLQEVQIRQDEWNARKSFSSAMADLHGRMGSVRKNQTATIKTRDGRTMQYHYADKHAIASAIRKAGAASLGLSWSWDYKDTEYGIEATCWAKHRDGHRESATWSSVKDGRDNPLTSNTQKKKILTTTAERVTLASVFGITDTEDDVDAPAMAYDAEDAGGAAISDDQAREIEAVMTTVAASHDKAGDQGWIDRQWRHFLGWLGVDAVASIPAARFAEALGALKGKVK